MRLPRRQPRTVYEVHDADDLLGELAGGEPASSGQQAGVGWEGEAGASPGTPVTQRPSRNRPGRALLGALLCLIAIFAISSIVLRLLSLAGSNAHVAQHLGGHAAIARRSTADRGQPSSEAPPQGEASRKRPTTGGERLPANGKPRRTVSTRSRRVGAGAYLAAGPPRPDGSRSTRAALAPPASRLPAVGAEPEANASTPIPAVVLAGEAVDEFGFER